MIRFSVIYASDTDRRVHVKVLELWILYFHGSLCLLNPFLHFSREAENEASVARAASRTMKDFPLFLLHSSISSGWNNTGFF